MGNSEVTELQSVDFALGATIATSFDLMAQKGPKDYLKFLAKPNKERFFRADHEDAGGLARKISNAEKGRGYSEEPPILKNKPSLPVVAYFRKPGMSNGDIIPNQFNKTFFTEDLIRAFKLSVLPITLEYSMTFAAWDTLTLDKMQLSWYNFITQPARSTSRFIVPTKIEEDIFETPANFVDPKVVLFSDTSPPKSDFGRIYSVSTDFTINTSVLVGELVTVLDQITIEGICSKFLR